VPLGTAAHDTATVTGAVAGFTIPGVTFTFEGAAIANGAGEAGFTANSINTGPLGANTAANPVYTFNATVASNDNYIGATSAPAMMNGSEPRPMNFPTMGARKMPASAWTAVPISPVVGSPTIRGTPRAMALPTTT